MIMCIFFFFSSLFFSGFIFFGFSRRIVGEEFCVLGIEEFIEFEIWGEREKGGGRNERKEKWIKEKGGVGKF